MVHHLCNLDNFLLWSLSLSWRHSSSISILNKSKEGMGLISHKKLLVSLTSFILISITQIETNIKKYKIIKHK